MEINEFLIMFCRRIMVSILVMIWSVVVASELDSLPLVMPEASTSQKLVPYKLRPETEYVAFYFSASWCGPCRATTPALVEEYQRMKDQKNQLVEVVLVSSDRTEKVMVDYIKRYHMPWPAVAWQSRMMTDDYAAQGIPHLALVRRSTGEVVAQGSGANGEGSV